MGGKSYASNGAMRTNDEHLHLSSTQSLGGRLSQSLFPKAAMQECFWFISFKILS